MAAARRSSSRLSAQVETKAMETESLPPPIRTPQNKRKRKATTSGPSSPSQATMEQHRFTTPTRRRTRQIQAAPPLTPTPSAATAIGQPAGGRKLPNPKVVRLADPRATNAALLSPETSRVVASKNAVPESEPESPSRAPATMMTTENLLDTACAHLIRVDERMRPLVEKNHCKMFSPEGLAERIDPFESLASGIISQQVSGAAAKSIKAKFVALFDDQEDGSRFPHPSEVAPCTIEKLRTAGLSQRKAEYIKGLADKFTSGELSAKVLHEAPYEELVEKLIAVRGLGKWSVEMFACFGLKRMDVFSVGDLGVQRGMAAFVGRDVAKLKSKGGKWKYMSEQDMLEISGKFAPYRSLFMWLMWRVEDSFTDVSTLG